MDSQARYLPVGDRGLTIEFGNEIGEKINRQVHKMLFAMEKANLPGIIELLPTFRSLFVLYDPLILPIDRLMAEARRIEEQMVALPPLPSRTFEIPVVYGGQYRQDLEHVAAFLKLTPEEVGEIHSGEEYLVYMNGFVGGTAFIKLPEKLAALPRKKTPVSWVPAGVVMFAAGIGSVVKPVDGPTGWHVIGKSPLKQWLPEKNPPLLILAGDRVRFQPITEEEYQSIKKQVDAGTYSVKTIGT